MEDKNEILNKAVNAIRNEQIPAGPSEDLTNAALEKLNEVSSQLPREQFDKQVIFSKRFMIINNLTRIAAVIILSIAVGYAAGRISAPRSTDMEQMQANLEPVIRDKLLEEVTQYVQLGLASNYVQLKQELTEQYQKDLSQAALEILNTSGTITNNLLEELIQSFATAQLQDRQLVAAAIQKVEQNRIADKTQLGSALVNFASRTEQDLQQTQQNVALIANFLTNTDNISQDENKNSDN